MHAPLDSPSTPLTRHLSRFIPLRLPLTIPTKLRYPRRNARGPPSFAVLPTLISHLCFTPLSFPPLVDTPLPGRDSALSPPPLYFVRLTPTPISYTQVPHLSFPRRLTRALRRILFRPFPLFLASPHHSFHRLKSIHFACAARLLCARLLCADACLRCRRGLLSCLCYEQRHVCL